MFKMKTPQRIVVCCLSLTLIAGCSTLPAYSAGEAPLWLLGEVHDNPAGHQQRFDWLRQQVEQGWRPVIALEQFDRPDTRKCAVRVSNDSDQKCHCVRPLPEFRLPGCGGKIGKRGA